jgi:hypothetical protein
LTKAKQACASFAENKNEVHSMQQQGNMFVCFRQKDDQYFTISYHHTLITVGYDPEKKEAISSGDLIMWVTDHGLEADELMPSGVWWGAWHVTQWGRIRLVLDASEKELRKTEGFDEDSFTASLGGSTFDHQQQYHNKNNELVTYELSISRETGRFRETWSGAYNESGFGRCVSGKLTTPNFQTAETEYKRNQAEQELLEDRRKKTDYCTDNSEADKGYCASKYIYLEDYQAAQKKKKPTK